ncbi:MAG: HNH endonuclease [Candidatus Thiodiazotropha sp.]|nr:HNH endonuclease [Candidatus Thiodiazotropha sp.]MCM8885545.1 HNH endonuclease [Candidatus Thiodiazotropha sp.]
MQSLILRVDIGGQPMGWMPWQEAAVLYVKERVAWTVGDMPLRFYGGVNRLSGLRSYIDVHPVVAARGSVFAKSYTAKPPLTNRDLFRRDRHSCMYCLAELPDRQLTRDHVLPISRGGEDAGINVVTACVTCNQRKGARTPEEANMRLYAVPYTPSYAEWLILRNRTILVDQMVFLQKK